MELQKFSSQASPQVLAQMKEIAEKRGQKLQHVLEEAMQLYIKEHEQQKIRPEVMAHFEASLSRHKKLYEKLAK